MQDGQAAHARVEDADGAGIHPRDSRAVVSERRRPGQPCPCGTLAPNRDTPVPGTEPPLRFAPMAKALVVALLAALLLAVRGRARLGHSETGRLDPDGRRRLDRGDAVRPGRRRAGGRLAGDRLPARPRREPTADERARRGLRLHGRELRRAHVRRTRPRAVGRARWNRRAARGRGHPRDPRLARRESATSRTRPSARGVSRTEAAESSTRSSRGFPGPPPSRSRRGPTSTRRSCRRGSRSRARSSASPARSRRIDATRRSTP